MGSTETEVRRQRLQLVIRMHTLHRQPVGVGVAQVARPVAEVFQAAECPRADAVERLQWSIRFDPAVDNLKVGEFQLKLHLDEKTGLLAIGIEQSETPLGE